MTACGFGREGALFIKVQERKSHGISNGLKSTHTLTQSLVEVTLREDLVSV